MGFAKEEKEKKEIEKEKKRCDTVIGRADGKGL
jgi:hypothetical protein